MRETWIQSLGWEDPLQKGKVTTPVFWPGEFHGLSSPWGCKELDTSEQLTPHILWAFQVVLVVKNPPDNAGDIRDVDLIPGSKDPQEKKMATHSSFLASEIPWTEDLGGLQSMGSQKSQTQLSD